MRREHQLFLFMGFDIKRAGRHRLGRADLHMSLFSPDACHQSHSLGMLLLTQQGRSMHCVSGSISLLYAGTFIRLHPLFGSIPLHLLPMRRPALFERLWDNRKKKKSRLNAPLETPDSSHILTSFDWLFQSYGVTHRSIEHRVFS